VGLGITDSPASLGTEVLTFAAQHPAANPFTTRKLHAHNLFSEAIEVNLEFEEDHMPTLTTRVKNMVQRFTTKQSDTRVAELIDAVELLLSNTEQANQQFSQAIVRINQLETSLQHTNAAFVQFKTQRDYEERYPSQRPVATGGSGERQSPF